MMMNIFTRKTAATLKKIPKKILVLSNGLAYHPVISSEIDFCCKDTTYDLLIYVDKAFRLNIDFPFSIANSEIWFERGNTLTKEIFDRAIHHFSECEIRNGV